MRDRPRVDLTINVTQLLRELADEVGLDIQSFCESALRVEVTRMWQEQNREAIEAMNAWVEKNGLPLEEYRLF